MSSVPVFADSALDSIPTPTAEQYADARAYLLKHAPDLLTVVLGGAA